MIVVFVRHGEAVSKDGVGGDDLARPLTEDGRRRSAAVGRKLRTLYRKVDGVLASPAARAVQTAAAVAEAFGIEVETTPLLSPGSTYEQFRELLRDRWREGGCLILVGHEPDISSIVSQVSARGRLSAKVGKAACVEVEVDRKGRGALRMLAPYESLCGD